MSHGFSQRIPRLFSTRTSLSWLVSTDIARNVRGGAGGWTRETLPLCFHRSNSSAASANQQVEERTSPNRSNPRSSSTQSGPSSSSHRKRTTPQWRPPSKTRHGFSSHESRPPSPPRTRNSFSDPPPYGESIKSEFLPWDGGPVFDDPGIRLRRIVRDAGLVFPQSAVYIARTAAGRALTKHERSPAGLNVSIHKQQVIHPWKMVCLNQNPHAYEKVTLRRLMEKRKEPLWWCVIMANTREGPGGVYVKKVCQRRVETAFKVALWKKGFDRYGNPLAKTEGKENRLKPIKGSVRFSGTAGKILETTVEELSENLLPLVDVLVEELDGKVDASKGKTSGTASKWRKKGVTGEWGPLRTRTEPDNPSNILVD